MQVYIIKQKFYTKYSENWDLEKSEKASLVMVDCIDYLCAFLDDERWWKFKRITEQI